MSDGRTEYNALVAAVRDAMMVAAEQKRHLIAALLGDCLEALHNEGMRAPVAGAGGAAAAVVEEGEAEVSDDSTDCSTVRVECDGPVTTIIMSRPERRNAVDRELAEGLRAAMIAFEADETQRVAVLWGEHGVFCAGADLTAVEDDRRSLDLDPNGGGAGPMGPTRLALSKPLIAAVAGFAVAGGLELALLADLRIAEESATFGVFCRRWGVPLIDGGTVRLPRIVGQGRALDMILTGRPVDAREALSFGLANRVVPDGTSRQVAEALAHQLADFPQQCMVADRRSAFEQWSLPLAEALRLEGRLGTPIVQAEGKAGARRFADGAGRHGGFEESR